MNILYVESDEKLINLINENCSESVHEIILLNNPKDALSFLKQTNNMDLIITEINFSTLNAISYLKEIRKLKKDILIVITSKLDIYLSSSEFLDLNISAILNKPLSFDKLKKTINNLFKEINIKSKNIT